MPLQSLLARQISVMPCRMSISAPNQIVVMTHLSPELESQLISCRKCHKQDVGHTSRVFRKRIYEHKFSVQKGQITPVFRHFKSEGHNHKDMLFSALEWCTSKFEYTCTSRCRRLEFAWIFKLHSLTPIGINQFV